MSKYDLQGYRDLKNLKRGLGNLFEDSLTQLKDYFYLLLRKNFYYDEFYSEIEWGFHLPEEGGVRRLEKEDFLNPNLRVLVDHALEKGRPEALFLSRMIYLADLSWLDEQGVYPKLLFIHQKEILSWQENILEEFHEKLSTQFRKDLNLS